jgi:hypothetical protein
VIGKVVASKDIPAATQLFTPNWIVKYLVQSEKTWLAHLAEDQRYAAMAGLGFSSGLPFLLVYSTQSAWLSEAGVPIETIGLLSELTIAYKFKFVRQ